MHDKGKPPRFFVLHNLQHCADPVVVEGLRADRPGQLTTQSFGAFTPLLNMKKTLMSRYHRQGRKERELARQQELGDTAHAR